MCDWFRVSSSGGKNGGIPHYPKSWLVFPMPSLPSCPKNVDIAILISFLAIVAIFRNCCKKQLFFSIKCIFRRISLSFQLSVTLIPAKFWFSNFHNTWFTFKSRKKNSTFSPSDFFFLWNINYFSFRFYCLTFVKFICKESKKNRNFVSDFVKILF